MGHFNARKEKDKIVEWIRNYYQENNFKGAVLGISGGKDSAVVAALLCEAIGKENVVGYTMPCHSKEEDKRLAKVIADKYGFKLEDIDLSPVFDTFVSQLNAGKSFTEEEKKNADINLKPRLRMAATYYKAALLSATRGGIWLVCGTGNATEYYVGYSTKWGDAGYDFNPIYDYTVQEVIAIGEQLRVPPEVLYRTPDDGMSEMSDEEKMGISYADVHKIIRGETGVSQEAYRRIEHLHKINLHKTEPIPHPVVNNKYPQVNKEPKWLYRLESKIPEKGLWYNSNSIMTFDIGDLEDCETKNLPMDYDWRYHKDGKQWWSACSRKEDLAHWYSLKNAQDLMDNDFVFTKYLATEYQEYEQETTFIKETALERVELSKEELAELFGNKIE